MKGRHCIHAGVLAAVFLAAFPTGPSRAMPPVAPVQPSGTRELLHRLVAEDQSLRLDPRRTEAHFHRARALEELGLTQAAADAYATYLKEDRSYRWSAEARRRLGQLPKEVPWEWSDIARPALRRAALAGNQAEVMRIVRAFPFEARKWGEDACLAEWAYAIQAGKPAEATAALTLARSIGRALVSVHDEWLLADAVAAIERADRPKVKALAHGHWMLRTSRGHRRSPGNVEWREAVVEAARAFTRGGSPMKLATYLHLGRSGIVIPAKYRALSAGSQLQQGFDLLANTGDIAGAHEMFGRADAMFARMGEWQNVWRVRVLDTNLMAQFGDATDHWGRLIPTAASYGYAYARSLVVREMARAAMRDQKWDIARSLLTAMDEPDPWDRVDLLLLQATAAWRTHAENTAKRHLLDARVLASSMDDERGIIKADLTEAAILRSSAPVRSKQLLAPATKRFTQKHIPGALAPTIAATGLWDAYFGESDLFTDLVGVLHDWGDPAAAFAVSERGRARLLLERMGKTSSYALGRPSPTSPRARNHARHVRATRRSAHRLHHR